MVLLISFLFFYFVLERMIENEKKECMEGSRRTELLQFVRTVQKAFLRG